MEHPLHVLPQTGRIEPARLECCQAPLDIDLPRPIRRASRQARGGRKRGERDDPAADIR
jgi:hypothetical protein